MHFSYTPVCLLMLASAALAADAPVVPLWERGAPGSEARAAEPEKFLERGDGITRVYNIHNPSLTVSLPPKDKANGAAIVVCPGGAHQYLAIDIEGYDVAKWLNSIGVAAFILKSRLSRTEDTPYKIEQSVEDAQRAIRLVRSRAAEWGVDPHRVGLMGFSAGAHLSFLTATATFSLAEAPDAVDKLTAHPDFAVLVYGGGLRAETVTVPKDFPPTLLLSAADDNMATQGNLRLFPALLAAGVPAEMHIYERGGHGFGIRGRSPEFKGWSVAHWPEHVAQWLNARGLLNK